MTRNTLALVLLFVLLISGCGQASAPEADQAPIPMPTSTASVPLNEWAIKMTHSGGIMGLSRSIEVSSNGNFTVVDHRTNKTISGELPADELSKLGEQLASPNPTPADKPNGMACADCFIYDLEVRKNGETFSVQLSDITLPNSKYESLITQLRDLMDAALK
jgi:hypothetical protein